MTNTYNLTPQSLINWRKALGKVRSNGGNARITCIGDSTTFGLGSTGSSIVPGNFPPLAYPAQLSQALNAAGVNATWQGLLGDQGTPAPFFTTGNDNRLTAGAGWATTSQSVGGAMFANLTASSGALSFLPTINVDTFRILYSQQTGSFSWNINGGSPTTVNQGSAGGIGSTTVSAPSLGSNTLNINQVSGIAIISGIEAWNSAISQVIIDNGGWSTSSSMNWNNAFGNGAAVTSTWTGIAPDLVIVNLGINDWNLGVSAATYTTNMQALLTAIKNYGSADILLVTPTPTNPTQATLVNQQALITAMYALAQSNNLPLIDNWQRWTSYSVSQSAGYYADAVTHPNAIGYADQANAIANVLLGV